VHDVGIARIGTSNNKCLTNTTLTGVSAWALLFLPPVLATGVVSLYVGTTSTYNWKNENNGESLAVALLYVIDFFSTDKRAGQTKENNNMPSLGTVLDVRDG
jgi:hypothetical protein